MIILILEIKSNKILHINSVITWLFIYHFVKRERLLQNKLVDINNLTELEINTVKKKLVQINEFKTKLNFDFKAVSF